jgi:DNA-directed RNA polymerase beta' subunit
MDLFVEKTDSLKAGNISGVKIKTTTIDYEDETLKHYVEHQVRDAEGDVIGVVGKYTIVELTHDEFLFWVNQTVVNATTERVNLEINPPTE